MQRGFGWTHYIHPQINQIDTPIPINIEIGLGHTVTSVFFADSPLALSGSNSKWQNHFLLGRYRKFHEVKIDDDFCYATNDGIVRMFG